MQLSKFFDRQSAFIWMSKDITKRLINLEEQLVTDVRQFL